MLTKYNHFKNVFDLSKYSQKNPRGGEETD